MQMNQLLCGDNLEVLRTLPDASVDLIYLDPPFFSNRNYKVIWGDKGEVRSFNDRWSGGMNHYIEWLKERVAEMHRILKSTGSLYLHCDWHADAYIRVLILDKLFGEKNFRNEIVWNYGALYKSRTTLFQRKHDNILLYSKSDNLTFNVQYCDYSDGSKGHYKHEDEGGLYRFTSALGADGKRYKKKIYLGKGSPMTDVWSDIPILTGMSKERLGYPTQKPEALLERIIKASSNEGDVVLDPFVGGGTTIAVAEKLNRKWIGIDQSVAAISCTKNRIKKLDNHIPFLIG